MKPKYKDIVKLAWELSKSYDEYHDNEYGFETTSKNIKYTVFFAQANDLLVNGFST